MKLADNLNDYLPEINFNFILLVPPQQLTQNFLNYILLV